MNKILIACVIFLAIFVIGLANYTPTPPTVTHPGVHSSADGKEWVLNPGCHWVYPGKPNDFQAYCGDRVASAASAIDRYFDRLNDWCFWHPQTRDCR